jgi:AraC-like DNA-binding protein
MPAARPDPPSAIRFDRMKYGRPLLVDACEVAALPTFITTPRAHRLHFYEIALVTAGRGRLALDDTLLELAPRRVFITAPGEVRSWRLDGQAPLGGWLAFFEADFIDEFLADRHFLRELPVLAAPPERRALAIGGRRFDQLAGIVAAMADELGDLRQDSCHALRADTYRLLVALQRAAVEAGQAPAASTAPPDREARVCAQFHRLLDEGVSGATSVAALAGRLGLSARRLNECLHARTGHSAGEHLAERLMREARRLLLHTTLPAAAIAERLEFADASYFGRFFRRHAGTTPAAFRRAPGSASAPPLRPLPPARR